MTYYTAKEIAAKTGLQSRHVWADVKARGIKPEKAHGVLAGTCSVTR